MSNNKVEAPTKEWVLKLSNKFAMEANGKKEKAKTAEDKRLSIVMLAVSDKINLKRAEKYNDGWLEFLDCYLEKLGAGVLLSIDEFSINQMGERAGKSDSGKKKKKHKKNKGHGLNANNKPSNDGSVSGVMEIEPAGGVDLNLTEEEKKVKELEVKSVGECCSLFENLDLVAVDNEGDKAERNHGVFYTDFSTSNGNVRALVNKKEPECLANRGDDLSMKKKKKKKSGIHGKKENEEPRNCSEELNQKQRVSAAVKKAITSYSDIYGIHSPSDAINVENWRVSNKSSRLERECIKKDLIGVVLETVRCAHPKESTEKVNVVVVDLSKCNDEIIDALYVAEALSDPVAQLILGWVRVAQSEQVSEKEKYSTFIDAGSLFNNAYCSGNIQGLYSLYWLAEFTGYAEFFSGSIFSIKKGYCFSPVSTEIPIIRFLLPGNSSLLNKEYESNAIIPIEILRHKIRRIGREHQESEINKITNYLDKTLSFDQGLAAEVKAEFLYNSKNDHVPRKGLGNVVINITHQACCFIREHDDVFSLLDMSRFGIPLDEDDHALVEEVIEKLLPAFVSYIILDKERSEKNKGILKAAGLASLYYTSLFFSYSKEYLTQSFNQNLGSGNIKYINDFLCQDNDELSSHSSYLHRSFHVCQTFFIKGWSVFSSSCFIDLCHEYWGLQVASYQDFIDRLAMIKGFFDGAKSDRVKIINHQIDFVGKKYLTIDDCGEHFSGAGVMDSNRKASYSYIDVKNGSYDFPEELVEEMRILVTCFYGNVVCKIRQEAEIIWGSDTKENDLDFDDIDNHWYRKIKSVLNKLICACQTMSPGKYSKAPATSRAGHYKGSVKKWGGAMILLKGCVRYILY